MEGGGLDSASWAIFKQLWVFAVSSGLLLLLLFVVVVVWFLVFFLSHCVVLTTAWLLLCVLPNPLPMEGMLISHCPVEP